MPKIPDLPRATNIAAADIFPLFTVSDSVTRQANFETLTRVVSTTLVGSFATQSYVYDLDNRLTVNMVTPEIRASSTWVVQNSSVVGRATSWVINNSSLPDLDNLMTWAEVNSSNFATKSYVADQLLTLDTGFAPKKTSITTSVGVTDYPLLGYTSTRPENYLVVLDGIVQRPGDDYIISRPAGTMGIITLIPAPASVQNLTILAYQTIAPNTGGEGGGGFDGMTIQDNGGRVGLYGGITTINFAGDGVTTSGNGATTTVTINKPIDTGILGVVVKDEGTLKGNTFTDFNFTGAGVSVESTENGKVANIQIPGTENTIEVQNHGNILGTAKKINFTGNIISTARIGDQVTLDITAPAHGAVEIQNSGMALGDVTKINFAGNSVVATRNNDVATININTSNTGITQIPDDINEATTWVEGNSSAVGTTSTWVVNNSAKIITSNLSVGTTTSNSESITGIQFDTTNVTATYENRVAHISITGGGSTTPVGAPADSPELIAPVITSIITTNEHIYTINGFTNTAPSNYLVFLNGVIQAPGTGYTINDTGKLLMPSSTAVGSSVLVFAYQTSVNAIPTSLTTLASGVQPYITRATGDGQRFSFAVGGFTTNNASGYLVVIEGLVQLPDIDYTASNGNIVFSEPPTAGSSIVVFAYQTLPGNALPSAMQIGALPLAGGTVSGELTVSSNAYAKQNLTVDGSIVAGNSITTQQAVNSQSVNTTSLIAQDTQTSNISGNTATFNSLTINTLNINNRHFFNTAPGVRDTNANVILNDQGVITGLRSGEVYNISIDGLTRPYDGVGVLYGCKVTNSNDTTIVEQPNASIKWPTTTTQAQIDGVPIGTVAYYAASAVPAGYLECNGSIVSIATFPDLAAAIYVGDANNSNVNITFGQKWTSPTGGSRSTTGAYISLPDLRGEFLRGWDHGKGVDSSRAFSSTQSASWLYTHVGSLNGLVISGGEFDNIGSFTSTTSFAPGANSSGITGPKLAMHPRNVALLPCIKASLQNISQTSLPTILTHPLTQTIDDGQNVSFNVIVRGAPPLTYQWKVDGSDVAGATNSSYTINNATANAVVQCVVANDNGSTTSNSANLTVIKKPAEVIQDQTALTIPPIILRQPVNQVVSTGQSASFNVGVDGTEPLSFQWKINGAPVTGATGSSYTLNNITANTTVQCTISNSVGTVDTNSTAAFMYIESPFRSNIIAGVGHNFLINSAGRLYVTGLDNTTANTSPLASRTRTVHTLVAGLSNTAVKQAFPLQYTDFAVTQTGAVYGWGNNFIDLISPTANFSVEFYSTPRIVHNFDGLKISVDAIYGSKRDTDGLPCLFAVTNTGAVYAWGHNSQGMAGVGSTAAYINVPALVQGLPPIKKVATTEYTSFFLAYDGSVYMAGNNAYSYRPTTTFPGVTGSYFTTPRKLELPPIKDLAPSNGASYTHYWIGTNNALSATTTVSKLTAINTPPLKSLQRSLQSDYNSVDDCIFYHGMDSNLSAVGYNIAGVFGNGAAINVNINTPTLIATNVVDYNLGAASAFVLTTNGILSAAGLSQELGIGAGLNLYTTTSRWAVTTFSNTFGASALPLNAGDMQLTTPVIKVQPPQAVSVSSGQNITLSVIAAGQTPLAYQWQVNGSNVDGATNSHFNLNNITADCTVLCIVSNSLATVNTNITKVSIQKQESLATLNNVSTLGAGNHHSIVLGAYGTVSATGLNSSGQLGDNTKNNRNLPTVINVPPSRAVVAGDQHTVAVGLDSGLSAWGSNTYGQLGTGIKTVTQVNYLVTNDAMFNKPGALTKDILGNMYIADTSNNRIRKVDPDTRAVTTIAGTGVAGAIDGPGTSATFNAPLGVACDLLGNIYVTDTGNHKIRKITPEGVVSTLAGTGTAGAIDGAGAIARFNSPQGAVLDFNNNLYVVETAGRSVRKISPTGAVSTLCNTGLTTPTGIAINSTSEYLFIADSGSHKIFKLQISTGALTVFAGTGTAGAIDGLGNIARFNAPTDIVIDPLDNIFVTDTGNQRVRKLDMNGVVSTLAGNGVAGYVDGGASVAQFRNPTGITCDARLNVYVADRDNNRIRRITSDSDVLTYAGTGVAGFKNSTVQTSFTTDILDVTTPVRVPLPPVRSITAGKFHTLAVGMNMSLSAWGRNDSGQLGLSSTINNDRPRLVNLSDVVAAAAGDNHSMALTRTGKVYTWGDNTDGQLGNGRSTTQKYIYNRSVATDATFNSPQGVAVRYGVVYVADTANNRIRKIDWDGTVTTIAGTGARGLVNGAANIAVFNSPCALAVDGFGNIYVADTGNNVIRKIDTSNNVTTFAGTGNRGAIGNNVQRLATNFNNPRGIACDSYNHVFVADTSSDVIRRIDVDTGIVTNVCIGVTMSGFRATINNTLTTPTIIDEVLSVWFDFYDTTNTMYVGGGESHIIFKCVPRSPGPPTIFNTISAIPMDDPAGTVADPELGIYSINLDYAQIQRFGSVNKVGPRGGGALVNGNLWTQAIQGRGNQFAYDSLERKIYVADITHNVIRVIDVATDSVTTFAGTGAAGFKDSTVTITSELITTEADRTSPGLLPLPPVRSIAANYNQSYAVGINGQLSAWGANSFGQLGIGTTGNSTVPLYIPMPVSIKTVAAGGTFALALGVDGTLYATGNNAKGQLGDNTLTSRSKFGQVSVPPVKDIIAGLNFAMALGVDGVLSAWGCNEFGELGIGNNIDQRYGKSVQVPLLAAASIPIITTQPTSQIVGTGQSATFNVSVVGGKPIVYQWKLNDVPIAGATGTSYTVTNAQVNANITCTISNIFGDVTTNPATLTVNNTQVNVAASNVNISNSNLPQHASFMVTAPADGIIKVKVDGGRGSVISVAGFKI